MKAAMLDPKYSFISPRRQLLSLPPTIIYSMLSNPSSHKGLLKLYKTCKYFYSKRPILMADDVHFDAYTVHGNPNFKATNLCHTVFTDCTPSKTPVWLTNILYIGHFSNQKLPPFYRYSLESLNLMDCTLHFDDFVLLTSEKLAWNFDIGHSSVYHPDGSKATIYEILQNLPNIIEFCYFLDERCSLEMLTKLNAMKIYRKFEYVEIRILDVHDSFDMNLFCEFFDKNSTDKTYIVIYLRSDEAEEKMIQALEKMDPKWKKQAHEGLREFMFRTDPNPQKMWKEYFNM